MGMWLLRPQRILQSEEKTKLVMQDAFKKVPPFQGVTSQTYHPSPSPSPSPEGVKGPSNQTYHPSPFPSPRGAKGPSNQTYLPSPFYFPPQKNKNKKKINLPPFPFP